MSHLSTLTLHQLRYGELSPEEHRPVKAHLADCERCRARLQAQENNRAAFELAPVPEAIRAAAKPRRRGWRWAGLLVPALAAAAVALLAPTAGLDQLGSDASLEAGERTKGLERSARLQVWLEERGEGRLLVPGATVSAGDRVQLKYRAARGWVTLAGVDGRGEVEVYRALEVPAGADGWQTAPFSLTLDDAPGHQDFYAVFTERRPDPQQIADWLAQNPATTEANSELKIERVSLVKAR